MKDKVLADIKDALMKGDREGVAGFTKAAIDLGIEIKDILDKAFILGSTLA